MSRPSRFLRLGLGDAGHDDFGQKGSFYWPQPRVPVLRNRRNGSPPSAKPPAASHTNSSVRYLADNALARWMRSACSAMLSFGGGAVRLSTGSPIAMKNSSCPDGVHMQSRRAGLSDLFLNEWGALAGMFTVEPAS